MSITLRPFLGTTMVSDIPTIANGNSDIIQTAVNEITTYVDTTTKTITNVEKLTVVKGTAGTPNPSVTGIDTNTSAKIDGNIVCAGAVSAKTLSVSPGAGSTDGIVLNTGNLTVSEASSTTTIGGNLSIAGATIQSGISATSFVANSLANYVGGWGYNNDDVNNPIGYISLVGKSNLVLDFTGYVVTVGSNVKIIKFLTTNAIAGQVVNVIFRITEPLSIQIQTIGLANGSGWAMTNGITVSHDYSVLTLMYTTDGWLVLTTNNSVAGGIAVN